jgi:hypothetical protein
MGWQSLWIKRWMPRSGVQYAILLGVVLTLSAGVWMFYRQALTKQAPVDTSAQFLARHWAQPLAPQGDPPPGFSPVEASLAPESCGACHPAQYADWRTSLHSRAIGPGILWQFRVLSQKDSNHCLNCHAPLAEQKALTALQHNWANAPKGAVPSYVSGDLHLQGLVCAACHVRRHQRFGPPPNARNDVQAAHLPHNGFVVEQAFQDSRFCSTCHQFPPQGKSLAGKLVENTYEEWRSSPAAGNNQSCQACHMPGRRHLWRGIHDPAMVAKGIRRELDVKWVDRSHLSVQATISAPGVGHYFPTYVVPKVTVSLHLQNAKGDLEIARHVIGRTVSVDMDQEYSDTRIPPGGKAVVTAEIPLPPGSSNIVLHIQVAPAEHYVRMYQSMLDRNPDMDAVTQTMLRKALLEALSATYQLDELAVAVPGKFGESRHVVAN